MKVCEGTESLKTLKSMQNFLSLRKNIKHQFTANIFQFYDIFLKQPYNQRGLLGRGCILKTIGVIKKTKQTDLHLITIAHGIKLDEVSVWSAAYTEHTVQSREYFTCVQGFSLVLTCSFRKV